MTTVVISGANRGIGLELARKYAADGVEVVAGVRDPDGAGPLKAIPGVQVHKLDVREDASVEAFHRIVGERPIDILIANAGVYGGRGQRLGALDFTDWLEVLDVNSLGPARLAQAFLPNLKAGQGKKLVAITSTMGSSSAHDGNSFIYRSSKAALNNVWAGLAKALERDGITCLPLHPGWVKTDMGGPNAQISVQRSADGLREVIARSGPAESGQVFAYDGQRLPW